VLSGGQRCSGGLGINGGDGSILTGSWDLIKNYFLIFRNRSSTAIDTAAIPAANPGVFVVFESPVIYSDVVPALIVMVVLRSWYPSITRVMEWGPAVSMGIVVGVTPIITPSTYTSAPVGEVVIDNEPYPGVCAEVVNVGNPVPVVCV